jgi:hypothetical protein
MRRCWKLLTVLVVLGIAAFLVWAFRSDPNRGVAIRFLGYENGGFMRYPFPPSLKDGPVTAQFCLTNGGRRAIAFDANGRGAHGRRFPYFISEIKHKRDWNNGQSVTWRPTPGPWGSYVLTPGESLCFSVHVSYPDKPLRVTIQYSLNPTNIHYVFTHGWQRTKVVQGTTWGTPRPKGPVSTGFAKLKERVSGWFHRKPSNPTVSITIQE